MSSFALGQSYVNANAEQLLESVNSSSSTGKTTKVCYTLSCCSIGPFGVEIWSETTCYFVSNKGTGVVVMDVKDKLGKQLQQKAITVPNDFVLAGSDLNSGEVLTMKAGDYKIINGQIAFEPTTNKGKTVCFGWVTSGQIFGNPYSGSFMVCITWFSSKGGDMTGGLATLDISKDKNLLALAQKNGEYLELAEDTKISSDELKASTKTATLVIPKGRYVVSNNMMYIQNAKFE